MTKTTVYVGRSPFDLEFIMLKESGLRCLSMKSQYHLAVRDKKIPATRDFAFYMPNASGMLDESRGKLLRVIGIDDTVALGSIHIRPTNHMNKDITLTGRYAREFKKGSISREDLLDMFNNAYHCARDVRSSLSMMGYPRSDPFRLALDDADAYYWRTVNAISRNSTTVKGSIFSDYIVKFTQ